MGKGKVFAEIVKGAAFVHMIYSVNGVQYASHSVLEQDAFMAGRRVDASIAEAAVFVNTLNYATDVQFVLKKKATKGRQL